ncbi:uncharacterized protein LTR77_007787 [Saxophila tyrrhenica]|uniref:Uncharacterized protein n=1 Tax=Saxophila tyrrhenica TaxID=1690608 RepID=A0AAV9P2Y8_9PEZI|nr:hypothetical protein LTR77_007787 [Saxophila tyrrhenica]
MAGTEASKIDRPPDVAAHPTERIESSTKNTPDTCPFLRLPGELHNKIYAMVDDSKPPGTSFRYRL